MKKDEIPRLAEALDIPGTFLCHQGSTAPGIEGLCLLRFDPSFLVTSTRAEHDI